MKARIALLIFLAIVFIGLRVFQAYFVLLGNDNTPPINVDIRNGHPVVRSVTHKHLNGQETSAFRSGIRQGDVILGVYNERGDGRELKNQEDVNYVIRKLSLHDVRIIEIQRKINAKVETMRLTMPPESPNDSFKNRTVAFLSNCGVPFIAILTGLFIGFMKPEDDNAFVGCLLFLGFSSLFGYTSALLPSTILKIVEVTHLTLNNFLAFLFVIFFVRFPSASPLERKAPWLKYVFFVISLLGLIVDLTLYYAQYSSFALYSTIKTRLQTFIDVSGWLGLLMVLTGLVSLALNTIKADSLAERRRMVILLTGTAFGILPLIFFLVYMHNSRTPSPPIWLLITVISTMAIFPISFIYVVLKHRVLGIKLIIRRGLQYVLISRGYILIEGSIVFLLLYFISKMIFKNALPNAGPLSVALYSVLLTVFSISLLERMNRPIMQAIDRRFFREAYKSQQILTNLSRAVRQLAAQPEKLLQTVTAEIADSLHPDRVAVFVHPGTSPSLFSKSERTDRNDGSKLPASKSSEFQCLDFVESKDNVSLPALKDLNLSEQGFLSRHLNSIAADEIEPIEVYLDDPKTWAGALVKWDESIDRKLKERELLERLNTKLILPLVTNNRVLGFLSLGEKLSEEPYSKEDKELLLAVAQQTAIALDYAQLIQQVTEQEKLKREIEIAKQVQAQLFPQTFPEMKTLDYTGMCRAARGVGGDYYDFLLITPEKLGIALGDISGKGISAALLMASLQALLRSNAPSRMDQVSDLIGDINRLMQSSAAPGKYATFFYALYDQQAQTLTYVNAGHLPPVILHATGAETRLRCGGMVIGMLPDVQYLQETVRLESGDIFVSFSDGVTEAMNPQDEEYGEERLCRLISENRDLSAEDLQDLIVARTDEFVAGAPQHDDFTLVIAKVL